jgi:small subunit ribosomal protein S15
VPTKIYETCYTGTESVSKKFRKLGLSMALDKERKQKLMSDFGINKQDTGSADVQVAMLTERIKDLTEHCKENKKDFSSKRGLLKMVCRRRSFLNYVAKKDESKYKELIQRLGLRK